MKASASATLTSGFRRNTMTFASFTPVAVETTLTPPDSSAPLTFAEDLVIAIETVGSVEACAEPAAARPPATARRAQTARVPAKLTPLCGARRLQLDDMRLILSFWGRRVEHIDAGSAKV